MASNPSKDNLRAPSGHGLGVALPSWEQTDGLSMKEPAAGGSNGGGFLLKI